MRHLRAGQDRRARIGEAVEAFRRLAPEDYGHFLATIEGDLGDGVHELAGAAPQLLLTGPAEEAATIAPRGGTLREAVLALLTDGRARSTQEIRSDLEQSRPVKRATLNTEIFTLRKNGLLRSEGKGRGRKHSLAKGAAPAPARAPSSGKRETTTRAARRKRDDDEDHPARALPRDEASEVRREPRQSAERIYGAAIGTHHLLSAAEEQDLARRLEEVELALWVRLLDGPLAGEARQRLLELDDPVEPTSAHEARMADLDRLVATRVIAGAAGRSELAEERAALLAIAAEADRIRDRFISCNLRLVPSTIRRHGYHLTTNLAMSDLIQEGNFGLLKAVSRFDHRRGLRFSTFATWWIRHYLVRARQNLGAEVRVPVHLHDLASKVTRARAKLRAELGRAPDQAELARDLGVSKKSLATLESAWLKHREAIPSFDSVGEDGSMPAYLTSDAALADEVLSRHQEDAQITAAVAKMSPLLAQIVRRRFGLDGDEPETLLQIGERMNLSRERIRQLEKKALSILRRAIGEADVADAAA